MAFKGNQTFDMHWQHIECSYYNRVTTTIRLVPIKATESITGNFLDNFFPMVSIFNCKGKLTYCEGLIFYFNFFSYVILDNRVDIYVVQFPIPCLLIPPGTDQKSTLRMVVLLIVGFSSSDQQMLIVFVLG